MFTLILECDIMLNAKNKHWLKWELTKIPYFHSTTYISRLVFQFSSVDSKLDFFYFVPPSNMFIFRILVLIFNEIKVHARIRISSETGAIYIDSNERMHTYVVWRCGVGMHYTYTRVFHFSPSLCYNALKKTCLAAARCPKT